MAKVCTRFPLPPDSHLPSTTAKEHYQWISAVCSNFSRWDRFARALMYGLATGGPRNALAATSRWSFISADWPLREMNLRYPFRSSTQSPNIQMKALRESIFSVGQFRDRFFEIYHDRLRLIIIYSLSIIIFRSHFMLCDRCRWTNRKVAGRFPMVPMEFLIDIILPIALWPWGWLSL